MIIVYIISAALLLIIVFVFLVRKKSTNEEWPGDVVVAKEENKPNNSQFETTFSLIVKQHDGYLRKVLVSHKLFQHYNEGDILIASDKEKQL